MKFIAVLFVALIAFGAKADESPLWKQVADWEIRVDKTLSYGCFMLARWEGGTILRLGFDKRYSKAYLMIGNLEWSSIEVGKDYELDLQLDNESPWKAVANAKLMGSLKVLAVTFTQAQFIEEFMRKQSIGIRYRGNQVAQLRLTNSFAAGEELLRCQEVFNTGSGQGTAKSKDPFVPTGQPRKKDPFSN